MLVPVTLMAAYNALQLLETCVKNCSPQFHVFLATSELWTEFVKLAGDSSITRVGAISPLLSPCTERGARHNGLANLSSTY